MRFEYKPLIPICRNDVNYAPQRISSKPWWNSFVTSIATGIERFILNINHSQLDIEETQYVCHHEHRFSRDNISRVKHYRVSDKKAVIIFPQGGNGYNFAQLAACYLAANGISAYELQRPIREDNLAEPFDNLDILSVKEIFSIPTYPVYTVLAPGTMFIGTTPFFARKNKAPKATIKIPITNKIIFIVFFI